MLSIISVEAHLDRIYESLYDKLAEHLSRTEKVHLETQHGLDVLYWGMQKVMVLRKNQSSRFPFRELQTLIEEYKGTDLQLWTRIKLNEGQLRKLRTFEAAGAIRFRCYLVSPKVEAHLDYKELERIVKISQNKPLGAEWITERSIPEFVVNVVNSGIGLEFPIETLSKVSSADTPAVETPLSKLMRSYYTRLKERAIHWYPKTYVHKAMDEEKWGVDPLPRKEQGKVKRHVLVTGTGRSGTTYFSDLLTLLGLDVGHQRNGNDGCSGAEFAIDSDWYPWFPVYGGGDCANVGERRSDYTYKHVLHIVRHPLWCIPSLMKNYPAINPEFWADNSVMDPIVMSQSSIIRNASMYYGINKAIDDSGQAEYRCQLEEIHEHWDELMAVLEMPNTPDPSLKASNQASGWGQYEPLTWAQLENEVGSSLANSIREQAKMYGYE